MQLFFSRKVDLVKTHTYETTKTLRGGLTKKGRELNLCKNPIQGQEGLGGGFGGCHESLGGRQRKQELH